LSATKLGRISDGISFYREGIYVTNVTAVVAARVRE